MKSYLSLVKFSHTIFALPFALLGMSLGFKISQTSFDITLFLKILVCMISARNAAMAFNRYIDREIDKKNPRTASREIPSNIISSKNALFFIIINCIIFCTTTFFINKLCFYLSPIALIVILGYSYTKRFTFLCHLILGIGLGLAPIGAFIAVTNQFDILPVLYGFAVIFWVGGFDVIYALQDSNFDKENNLYSIPSKFGIDNAIKISMVFHILSASCIILAGYLAYFKNNLGLGILFIIANILFLFLLFYQQMIVREKDMSKINLAFFTTNGIASVLFGALYIIDLFN